MAVAVREGPSTATGVEATNAHLLMDFTHLFPFVICSMRPNDRPAAAAMVRSE